MPTYTKPNGQKILSSSRDGELAFVMLTHALAAADKSFQKVTRSWPAARQSPPPPQLEGEKTQPVPSADNRNHSSLVPEGSKPDQLCKLGVYHEYPLRI